MPYYLSLPHRTKFTQRRRARRFRKSKAVIQRKLISCDIGKKCDQGLKMFSAGLHITTPGATAVDQKYLLCILGVIHWARNCKTDKNQFNFLLDVK